MAQQTRSGTSDAPGTFPAPAAGSRGRTGNIAARLDYQEGYDLGYTQGFGDGYTEGYADGYAAGYAAGVGSIDTTPPTIAVVSPASPSGFPADYSVAKDTEVVLDVTDAAPGNRLIVVIATFPGVPPEIVYLAGSFRGLYITNSQQAAITNGARLRARRDGGWPGGTMTFEAYAIDQAGNLTP